MKPPGTLSSQPSIPYPKGDALTSSISFRRPRTAALIVAAAMCLLAACTGTSTNGSTGQSDTSAAAASSAAAAKDAGLIATAKQQAAQYDYDAAIATLAGSDSEAAKSELQAVQAAKAQAVTWPDNTTIPHIFYHSLIVDPDRAFNDGSEGVGFSQYMVTIDEFTKQLEQMYANGWVMVHPERMAAVGADGKMAMTPINLPPGKKPFVLSLDDTSYYEYMTGKGFATNLVVAKDGTVRNTYTDAAGTTTEGNYDCIPIVDEFVRQHPDFSYRGDKGSVALTGYNGILGYRTSVQTYGDTPTTKDEQAKAKVVADAIKAAGWNFASHSWGHINMTKQGQGWITSDAKLWDAEVRPLVGDTQEMIYPFGADVSDVKPYSEANAKFAFLHDTEGFLYYFGVDGASDHWVQLGPTSLRQARVNADGLSLQRAIDGKKSALTQFFDPASTIDPKRPMPVPSGGGPKAGGN